MAIGNFRDILRKDNSDGFIRLKMPKHIAIVTKGKGLWAKKNNQDLEEAYKKTFFNIRNTILSAIKMDIPIMTFYILSTDKIEEGKFSTLMDSLKDFFDDLRSKEFIGKGGVKIAVFGKWYDLPGRVVDSIKGILEETKDNDRFFVNFCINYSGQEEIVDAVKLVARQVKADRLDVDAINSSIIKENIYSSYFLPPDLMIVNGNRKSTNGLLLWDSSLSQIYYTNKLFPDFDRTEFIDAIKEFQKGK